MGGIVGCLPDNCTSFNKLQDAIDYLSELYNDWKGVKSQLRAFRIAYPKDSIEYCEIVVCYCDNPEIHNDD